MVDNDNPIACPPALPRSTSVYLAELHKRDIIAPATATVVLPPEPMIETGALVAPGNLPYSAGVTRASPECTRGQVLLYQAPAEIAGGLVDHYWLKTDEIEAGMGGRVAEPGEQYEAPYFTKVYVRDHSGQSNSREGAECRPMLGLCVNKVEEQLEIDRPLGKSHLLNTCATFCNEVMSNSRDPKWIHIPEIDIYP